MGYTYETKEFDKCVTCGVPGRIEHTPIAVCDVCSKICPVPPGKYLNTTVFYHRDEPNTERVIFCGWACWLVWFKTFKPPEDFYFMDIPYVSDPEGFAEFRGLFK